MIEPQLIDPLSELNSLGDEGKSEDGMESEEVRRHRRLIANSNERRRMQGINNGFEALRGFLACSDEQKLSKAAILQKTVEYIQQLLTEKSELVMRNAQLEKLVVGDKGELPNTVFSREVFVVSSTDHAVPIIKQEPGTGNRRKRKASTAVESVDDEGVASLYSEHSGNGEHEELLELREENKKLRLTLENERLHRRNLETQIRNLQIQMQHNTIVESAKLAVVAQDQLTTTGKLSNNNICTTTTPGVIIHDETPRCRTVSRNNLESIVEAIRRLEGDHLFADEDDHNELTPSPGSPTDVVAEEVEIPASDTIYMSP